MVNLEEVYYDEEEMKADLADYNKDRKKEERMYYISVYDPFQHCRVFSIVKYDYYNAHEAMEKEERELKKDQNACTIWSDRYHCYCKCHKCSKDECSKCTLKAAAFPKKSLEFMQEAYGYDVSSTSISPEKAAELVEMTHRLDTEIELLKPKDRQIMTLYRMDMNYREIGEVVKLDSETVRGHVQRITDYLRNKLKDF